MAGIGSLRYGGGQQVGMRPASYAYKRRTESKFLPAPIRGLNTMDPPEIMAPGYAVELVNWWPNENGVTTRGGSAPWCVGVSEEQVESVMVWNAEEAFAVADGSVYAVPRVPDARRYAPKVRSGLTSSLVQSVNFSNDGGVFLCCCNGTDAPFYYDGTGWTTATFTLNSHDFDASGFFDVTSHLSRLWWLKKNSQSLWYGGVNAIQGPVYELPLGAYLRRGGTLAAFGVLTQDGLTGSEDVFCVVSSEGEVLLFAGDNPDEATSWRLAGQGQIPRPVGAPRCIAKLGPDLVVMTESGLVGLNKALSSEFPGLAGNISDKIRSYWDHLIAVYGPAGDGWDICVYHGRDLIVCNLPGPLGHMQLVCNPNTLAWGTIQGWEGISCLVEYQGRLLGGGPSAPFALDYLHLDRVNGTEWHEGDAIWCRDATDPDGSLWLRDANDTSSDGVIWSWAEIVPSPISASVKHGYVAVGGAGVKKRFTLARPYLVSEEQPEAWFGIDEDFMSREELSLMFEHIPGGWAEWYTADWCRDAADHDGAEWCVRSGVRQLRSRWMQALGYGYFVAPKCYIQTSTQGVTYTGVDVQYEVGNAL